MSGGMVEAEAKIHGLLAGTRFNAVAVIDLDCDIQEIDLAASFFNFPFQDAKIINIFTEAMSDLGIIKIIPWADAIIDESLVTQQMT